MFGKLFGNSDEFFVLFERAAANVVDGAREFAQLIEARTPRARLGEGVARIKAIEHRGDEAAHETFARLNKTFITPLDREDIHSIISHLDDILDLIDETAMRLEIYPVDLAGPHADRMIQMSQLLLKTTEEVASTVRQLRSMKKPRMILDSCIAVNHLENEADQLFRYALAELIARETDPMTVMEWKELYEMLEEAVDTCEDTANVLESIVIKHA